MNKNKMLKKTFLLMVCLLPLKLFAANINSTQQATAKLTSACTISVTNVSFGNLDLSAASNGVSANGTLGVLCTQGTSMQMYMEYGDSFNNQYCVLNGSTKGDHIYYQIYTPPTIANVIWNIGVHYVPNTGTGSLQNFTFPVKVQTGQQTYPLYPAPDSYSDTVKAYINF